MNSREDLEEMLRSPAYFDAFFGTLPQTMAMYKEHEELLKANEEVTCTRTFSIAPLPYIANSLPPSPIRFVRLHGYPRHYSPTTTISTTSAKNMALRERHEALKKETSDAFNDARSLQHKWHNEIVPAQDEVYKVRLVETGVLVVSRQSKQGRQS